MDRFIDKYMEVVEKYADRLAFIDDKEALTFKQLDDRASMFYAYFKSHGIGKEDFVIIDLPRSVNTVAAMVGVFKAGAACCPLESTYPRERVKYIQNDLQCKLTLDSEICREILDTMKPLRGHEETDLHDAAYVVYTSGSTGNPKGVLHEYGKIEQNRIISANDRDAMVCALVPPFYFVAAFMCVIKVLLHADTTYIISPLMTRNIQKMKDFIEEKQLDWLFLPPAFIRIYTNPSPSLSRIITGSEPANGLYYPGGYPKIMNTYSMSESGMRVFAGELEKKYDVAPVGKPMLDIPVYLYDEDGKVIEGAGQGELCFLNEYVRGYINLPERTAKAWQNGIYHTGDIARRDEEGRYYIVGRIDDMIKINGNRIEPAEIEARVQDLTGLKKVIAKGFHEDYRSYVCVYYLRKEAEALGILKDNKLSVDKDKLKEYLPAYMIPAYYIPLEAFPIGPNGKIMKKELKAPRITDFVSDYEAPGNEMEAYFSEKMAEVLKMERFSATGNFFEMGAGSIEVLKLISICDKYPVSAAMLYRYPEPRLLVRNYTEAESMEKLKEENAIAYRGKYCLLPAQKMHLMSADGQSYASQVQEITTLLKLRENVDVERLCSAIDHVIGCHPALGTKLFEEDGGVCQAYDDALIGKTCVITVGDKEFDAFLNEKNREVKTEIFDKRLYESVILKYREEYYYYLSISHLVADGDSVKLLLKDIEQRYASESYEPEMDFWFLILKRYGDAMGQKDKNTEKSETIRQLALSKEKEQWYRALPADRNAIPVKGTVLALPDAFRWKDGFDGSYYATACLLAQSWYNKTDKAAILSVFDNRNETSHVHAFGMLAKGLKIFLKIEEKDTASSLLKKVRLETQKVSIGQGVLDQIDGEPEEENYMMRYNFLHNLMASVSTGVFEKNIPVRNLKKNIRGTIATNIVYNDGNPAAGLRVVYSTDVYDEKTIEGYVEMLRKAVEFLEQEKTIEEFLKSAQI